MATPASSFPVTERTRLLRHPERGSHARELILAILDEGLLAHVGVVEGGRPYVLPMAYARIGDTMYVHGAASNRLLRAAAGGAEVSLTVTLLDGLVLARSAYAHSMNYRSVVVYGQGREVTDEAEKLASLAALVEHVVPGRGPDVRSPSAAELAATLVVAVSLCEASAKVRSGPPKDVPLDDASAAWAGEIPLRLRPEVPVPDQRVPAGAGLPAHVAGWRRGAEE